jgi:hypothetical protein
LFLLSDCLSQTKEMTSSPETRYHGGKRDSTPAVQVL